MFFKQLYLLLWKNLILRKRHLVRTAVEIFWPLFLFAILVAIRQTQTIFINPECHYPARAMPSAGVYPLFKSLFCDLQNTCFATELPSEIPGQVNSPFNGSDNSTKFISSLLNLANGDESLSKNLEDILRLLKNGGTESDIISSLRPLTNQASHDDAPLVKLLRALPYLQTAGKQSFATTLLGADITSPNGFNKFCGHPFSSSNSNSTNTTENSMSQLFSNISSSLNTSSPTFCHDLLAILEDKNNTKLHVLFNLIKPFVLGKIPYYPNTALVQEIIANANSTFETLAQIQAFGENWRKSIGPHLYDELENGEGTNELRRTLSSESSLSILAAGLNIPVDQLVALRSFLSNDDDPDDDHVTWKDIFHKVDTTIAWVTKILECSDLNKFVGFDDEENLVEQSMQRVENKTLWASIVFLSPNAHNISLPKIVKYKIRQGANAVTKTTQIERYIWIPGAESNESAVDEQITLQHPVRYFISGFIHVQDMIESAIVITKAGKTAARPLSLGAYLQEMPYPCYTNDVFLQFLPVLFSLLMTLAWVYSVCIIIKNVVYEKEKRLKEVMKMTGLNNGVHWVAWFINSFLVMLCSIFLLLLFLKLGRILPYSNMFIVFLWLVSFCFATITQCFLISCFFTKANLAAACGGIIFFVLYIPYNVVYVFNDQLTYPLKLLACLLSSVSFGYGAGFMSQYEMSGSGIQFNNWAKNYDPNEEMTFLTSMIMMLVDAAFYMTLTWYVENVFPGTYGVPKRWNFFLSVSYWTGRKRQGYHFLGCDPCAEEDEQDNVKLEKEPTHLPLGVSMRKLKKVFGNGKVAVNNLSLNFYEGQITSFLGHNGAGKTTTMSMLTGLFPPTSGSATIYGHDIQAEMDQIRHRLGFCPQHNVLFGDLTVLEHLRFYAGLKNAVGGFPEDKSEIEQMLKDVGLPHKRNEITRHLSGGMKRKLSVAVAFVGGSKCVILDEPTAGVDPYARRGIWDLLLRYRTDRTIMLSTHHMDEADLLGDRIAIISHGQLKCCGSSLFLKSTYGIGYYLTVVKNSDNVIDDRERAATLMAPYDHSKGLSDSGKLSDEGFESGSDISVLPSTSIGTTLRRQTIQVAEAARHARINNLIFSVIPQAKIQEDNQHEATFILPYLSQEGGKYCKLFEKLDECGAAYGLTDTSLEEIFMNVAEQSNDDGEEETVNCCFCIPRKVSTKPQLESPDRQARRGMRRSTRSITSIPHNNDDDDVSLLNGLIDDDPDFSQNDDCLFLGNDGPPATESAKLKGNRLVLQQFIALFIKRFHNSRRNRKSLLAQIVAPSLFVALGLLCALAVPEISNYPPLELQPWMYGNTYSFYSNDKPQSNVSTAESNSLLVPPSLGMRCVQKYKVLDFSDDYLTCDRSENGPWLYDTSIPGYSQYNSTNQTLVCQCTTTDTRVLLADCPKGAGGSPTPRVLTQTSDSVYNMTLRNLSDWMVKTVDRFIHMRFGGLSFGENLHTSLTSEQLSPLVKLAETYSNFTLANSNGNLSTVQELAQNLARTENAKVWFDNTGFHSMPIWANVRSNAALRSILSDHEDPSQHGIVAINHPLNFTRSGLDAAARSSVIKWTLVSVCVIFALSFIPASFILFLIDEKTTKAKHLQFVSGVNPTIYWISTFVWDMINYVFAITIIILIFFAFQTKAYVSSENFPCLICLLFFYGFSITPMMYPASFYFEIPSTAYVVLTCVNMFIGINASLITFILQGLRLPYLDVVNDKLRQAFLIFPQYCLGRGLIDMAIGQSYADAKSSITGVESSVNPFAFEKVGRNMLVMAVEGVVFFALTLMIQYKFFKKPFGLKSNTPSRSVDVDGDILMERRRVLENRPGDILSIRNLTKVYRKRGTKSTLVAVDRLCVGVPKGECFGLLGVNGAGKTTTFKMLTGDTSPTSGDAYICGQSILDNLREVQQNTGYCPQFEALNSLLTGREHLFFYAKLRGVPPHEISGVADWSIRKFALHAYADKPAGTYSGGNKRKLSAAIAFIGNPPIVFLDEPTAGMDPMSRRFLWTRIIEAVRGGRSVVLTSHSMEECEALCTRLAIMVNGKLKCIGSPQHLKNRYGEGYTITIKVSNSKSNFDTLKKYIKSCFKTSVLKESHCNMLIYQLPHKDVKLSNLFVALEKAKKTLSVEDYSINQTTLDEVFVSFAKNQNDGAEDEYGFQPLNDEVVVDYSQSSDRSRERNRNTPIALHEINAGDNSLWSSRSELLA